MGVAGLAVAVDFILNHSMANRLGHERTMIQTVINRLGDDRRFTVYGSRDVQRHVGAVSVNVEGYDAVDVGAILDDSFEIAVRAGLHCAPYAHRRFGTFSGGTVRISPGPFNTDHHLEQLLNALDQIAGSS